VDAPGNTFSVPSGTSQPELMYCSFPNISKLPLGLNIFVLPVESIEDGSYDIALLTIAILVPFYQGVYLVYYWLREAKAQNWWNLE
jgi:hypothetical protein